LAGISGYWLAQCGRHYAREQNVEPTDEALIQACLRGESSAWETLVQRYQRLIYSIPLRAGLGEDLAAEVFQHVFATLVEQLPSIRHPDRIKAWLVTTAKRESWRISREQRESGASTSMPEGTGNGGMDVVDHDPLPDEIVERLEQQHAVRMAVNRLDERCRTLLLMLFYEADRPAYAEIAARLGTSPGSIGPTRARCLEKLRGMMLESG
jgi:RNA polymerase sigma factor (sigma-70 family)